MDLGWIMALEQKNRMDKKSFIAWTIYNWGHDPFAIVITSFVFSAYFAAKIAPTPSIGTAAWGFATAITAIVAGILAPFLGALADASGKYKLAISFFTLLTIVFTALLFLAQPNSTWFYWSLVFYGLALLGFELAMIYYNSLLKFVAPQNFIGRFSNWSKGLGYFGGIIALLIALFLFIDPKIFPRHDSLNIRLVSPFIAAWMLIFCWPILFIKKSKNPNPARTKSNALSSLKNTLLNIKKYRVMFIFVIARLFYIDALNTGFTFSGIYTVSIYHFSFKEVLIFGLAANIIAGIGCLIFSFIDDWLGPRFVIFWSMIILIVSAGVIFFTKAILIFWIFGLLLGLISGPLQGSSRSYLTRIAPPHLINQMFGFYTLAGRMTAFIGPLAAGILVFALSSVRYVMLVILILALIGLIIFAFLPKAQDVKLNE